MDTKDILTGKRTRTIQTQVSVTTSMVVLCGFNPNRVAIVITAPLAGNLQVSIAPPTSTSSGVVLSAGQYPFQCSLNNEGDLVRQQFSGIMSAGSVTITIWEVIEDGSAE